MKTFSILPVALGLLLPIAAQAQAPVKPATGINAEIRQSLADARTEVRAELAKARRDLDTDNLRLDHGFQIGKRTNGKSARSPGSLPLAEITPQGDFLIGGKVQQVSLSQRQNLLAYRQQVVDVSKAGIDIGQRTSEAVLKQVDGNWVGLLISAFTGNLERRVERTVKQEIEPGVRGLCRLLPKLLDSQQRLATSLPQFQPYAHLEQKDVVGCEEEIRSGFATL